MTDDLKERMETAINKEIQKDKEERKKQMDRVVKEETEKIEQFQDPDLLGNIKKELDKDHIGDDKEKMFLFACACSCRLIPEYRFSSAITGNSSEGKDSLWSTVKRHLPDGAGWLLDLTRSTTASLEDDIKEYNGLYFGEGNFEGGANAPIRDTIKQLVEDGIRTLKKDLRTGKKESRLEDQPRKVGIYSTTSHADDEELANRYCVLSVHGSPKKYKRVNENTKFIAANLDQQIDRHERKNKPTWIEKGLARLKQFDFILIPYAELLDVDSRDARSQRDLKRFLNFIRSLAWISQRNRLQYNHRGYKILVASPEDLYNAMEIASEIFNQSLTGMEPRLKKVVDAYQEIVKKEPGLVTRSVDINAEELDWVDRSILQKRLDIKKRETISEHINRLQDLNIFTTFVKGNRVYVALKFEKRPSDLKSGRPSDLPSDYPLITVRQNILYDIINNNYNEIFNEKTDGHRTVDRTVVSPDKIIRSKLLSLRTDRPSDAEKNVCDVPKSPLISTLFSKLDGLNRTVDPSTGENDEKDQTTDLRRLKEFMESAKNEAGFVSKRGVVATIKNVLCKKEPEEYFDILTQRGTITYYTGQGCQWTGGDP